MKMHLRKIVHFGGVYGTSFKVACGVNVHWTRHTTSDWQAVTCSRCRITSEMRTRREAAWAEKQKERT